MKKPAKRLAHVPKPPEIKMNISKFVKSCSHSKMTTFNFQHVWKIDKFSLIPTDNKFKSSMFSVAGHDLKFQLYILPKSREDENFIELYLTCFYGNTINGDIPINYELYLLKNNGSIMTYGSFEHIFNGSSSCRGYRKFAEYSHVIDPKNDFLHENHQLVVCCKVTVNYNRIEIQSLPAKSIQCESKFKSNQKSLLDSGELSDFTIVVGKTKIPVHKIILSAHSPVFKAMFSTYTKESKENKVNIPDVSVDAMKDFLQFIYTGVIPEDDRLSLELLTLANKYQVDELKLLCENYISSILNIENVVNVYAVADLHNATDLKAECLTFIANNFKQVSLTKAFEQMCEIGGKKMVEVIRALGNTQ